MGGRRLAEPGAQESRDAGDLIGAGAAQVPGDHRVHAGPYTLDIGHKAAPRRGQRNQVAAFLARMRRAAT